VREESGGESGLCLGNASRKRQNKVYESKGGNGVKIGMDKYMASRGSGGIPPGTDCFWCILRYLTQVRMTRINLRAFHSCCWCI